MIMAHDKLIRELHLHAVPSEGESCTVNDDDDDDDDVDETELEEELLAGSSFSGVVDRALIDLVGSMEVSCEDGFRCSSEGVCEPIEGIIGAARMHYKWRHQLGDPSTLQCIYYNVMQGCTTHMHASLMFTTSNLLLYNIICKPHTSTQYLSASLRPVYPGSYHALL